MPVLPGKRVGESYTRSVNVAKAGTEPMVQSGRAIVDQRPEMGRPDGPSERPTHRVGSKTTTWPVNYTNGHSFK